MAIDRHATGLTILRIFLGVFFLFEGLGKLRWFVDPSFLVAQLVGWRQTVAAGSVSARYLDQIAIPFAGVFARLVPIGEISCGVAMIGGVWTPMFALVAFLMVMNFHVASGAIFRYGFLTNGYGLPVFGATLALALGGVRLPLSLRKS
jgi:uncharacterized membrane protein YphA (DoxX/SURF4 family)